MVLVIQFKLWQASNFRWLCPQIPWCYSKQIYFLQRVQLFVNGVYYKSVFFGIFADIQNLVIIMTNQTFSRKFKKNYQCILTRRANTAGSVSWPTSRVGSLRKQ
jgi:hypothetical protein